MNYVLKKLDSDLLHKIIDQVNIYNKMVSADAVKIKDEDKMGIRAMAQGREGYVRLVAKVATQYENYLSRVDNASDLNELLKYYDELGAVRQSLMELFELIDGTQWGTGVDCMMYASRYNKSLQNNRDNSAIDTSMREIDEWNSRFGRDPLADEPDENTPNDAPDDGTTPKK